MKKDTIFPLVLIGVGFCLAAMGISDLRSSNSLQHSQNVFAIQGSAYGKLLARLSETTIDRVWHLGVEQIVPHYMSGKGHANKHPDHTSALEHVDEHVDEHGDEHGDEHEVVASTAIAAPSKPLIERGKQWFQDRVVAQHTRTNKYSLNERHLATVYKDIEHMLLRSFKMDPTHYGAYDSYHLFLTTYDFGGSPEATEQAKRIANVAIAAAFKETEDPEPWLTAAAAGMNLYLMDASPYMQAGTTIPLEILKEYQNKIGYCLSRFKEIQGQAEKSGNWERLSMERQMEISERALFAKRTFGQFDAMIARAETRKAPISPEEKVAKADGEKEQ